MKTTKIIQRLPILLILGYTLFLVPWKQNLYLLYYRLTTLEDALYDHINTFSQLAEWGVGRTIVFVLPEDRPNEASPDTMKIRFSKSKLTIIGRTDFNRPQFLWDMGYVDFWYANQWWPLHKNLDRSESFVVPIELKRGRIPKKKQSIPLSIIPRDMREGVSGGQARVILQPTKKVI